LSCWRARRGWRAEWEFAPRSTDVEEVDEEFVRGLVEAGLI